MKMSFLQLQFIFAATIRNQMGQTNEILGTIRKEQSLVKHNRNLHEQKKRIQTTGLCKRISCPINQIICSVYCCWIWPIFILRLLSDAELDLVPTYIENHCIHFPSFDWIIFTTFQTIISYYCSNNYNSIIPRSIYIMN